MKLRQLENKAACKCVSGQMLCICLIKVTVIKVM